MVAVLMGNFVWEGTASEMTDILPYLADGHIYKQLDTGESYIRRNGVWTFINPGLAFIKATKSGRATTDANGIATIVFTTPFINNEYTVSLSCSDPGGPPAKLAVAYKFDRSTAGFSIVTRGTNAQPVGGIEVSWLATRDYDP